MMSCNKYPLNTTFKYYFHDPNSKDWGSSSYIEISTIKNIQDFWMVDSLLKTNIQKGMFFIMRKNIFPLWDSKENIGGTFICLKIHNSEAYAYWNKVCSRVLTENMLQADYQDKWNMINGVSISPKKDSCIIKFWLGPVEPIIGEDITGENIHKIFELPDDYTGDIMIKKN
jgi:hypothetical protein